ncbi:ATP synthase F1 subunit gamma [Candidatus Uhrbacteria bacterium]|nr:ATP synthase F1 subunit gamma [Candidatus Uhrbacteria bacterium]
MAVSPRIIKRRIKSIRSTRKIMKAMELVAASKMRKATQLALGSRVYAQAIQTLSQQVQGLVDPLQHPLLTGWGIEAKAGQIKKTLLILVASDRGLCGGFNSQIVKKAFEFVRTEELQTVELVTIGRRAEQAAKRAGYPITASFESLANAPAFDRARPIAEFLKQEFLNGSVGKVYMAYTNFKSALNQIPVVTQLLPITQDAQATSYEQHAESDDSIIWEPSPDQVLDQLLPRAVDMSLYQGFLESAASEQSARMMAMRSAGDAAGEMLDDLTFSLNQARQAVITREISEISAGKAAIE